MNAPCLQTKAQWADPIQKGGQKYFLVQIRLFLIWDVFFRIHKDCTQKISLKF
jgi:hypothetical protein